MSSVNASPPEVITNTGPEVAPPGIVTWTDLPELVGSAEVVETFLVKTILSVVDPKPSPVIVSMDPDREILVMIGARVVDESSIVNEVFPPRTIVEPDPA